MTSNVLVPRSDGTILPECYALRAAVSIYIRSSTFAFRLLTRFDLLYILLGFHMNRRLPTLLAFLLLSGLALARSASNAVVVRGARLIDGTGRPPVEDAVLVIEAGRIRAVGASGAVSIPKGAMEWDAPRANLCSVTACPCHGPRRVYINFTRSPKEESWSR